MSDDKRTPQEPARGAAEELATPEELQEAEELRRMLERAPRERAGEDARAAALLVAHGGRAKLGELAARSIVRGALEARRMGPVSDGQVVRPVSDGQVVRPLDQLPGARRRRWLVSGGAAIAAAAAALALVARVERPLPAEWRSRPSDRLTPGPFPATQTAAQRLDLVLVDRMVALREARLYGARR